MGKILLYYKYVDIETPELIAEWQRELCTRLELKGRIIVAHEGINGTVGGQESAISEYKQVMHKHPLFSDVVFKESIGSSEHFPRMRIVVKEEIVRLGISPEQLSVEKRSQHLSPREVHEKLSTRSRNLVIFDARNNYESRIGSFKGAITPDIGKFRDLPDFIDKNIDLFKDKEVIMYCTGGVRCERASAYLESKGVAEKIYQLEGGIHCYLEEYPDGFFRGKNFVFDGRITLSTNNDILAQCIVCEVAWDTYTHCIIASCNKFMVLCNTCNSNLKNTCSETCMNQISLGAQIRPTPSAPKASCEL